MSSAVARLRDRAAWEQLARFLIVGVGNTVLSVVVYRLLLATSVSYVVATPIAYAVGVVNGYVFNHRWTFVANDTARTRVRYVAIQVSGAVLASVLVQLFVREAGVGKVLAFVAAVPPVTLCMFVANRLWAFPDRAR